jgi:hypothetical protein
VLARGKRPETFQAFCRCLFDLEFDGLSNGKPNQRRTNRRENRNATKLNVRLRWIDQNDDSELARRMFAIVTSQPIRT